MKRILLYPHGGSGNHGCEAIVRSTVSILQQEVALFSSDVQQDIKYGLSDICEIRPINSAIRRDINYLCASIRYRLFSDSEAFDRLAFQNIFKYAQNAQVALSIGGDNYCYGVPRHIMFINKTLRKIGLPTILWGGSIEPSAINDEFIKDLQGYKLIVARESLTKTALEQCGLSNVVLAPDPAFVLPSVPVDLPEWWNDNIIGINASPMILNCSKDCALTLANYEELIEHIIKSTSSDIALIPHVVWQHNDDRVPLRLLYEKYAKTGRIHIIENDFNAEQLKFIISKLRTLITARTHASIASYSTSVPTIVMGYSVKAKGIATDLFDNKDLYILPVQDLSSKYELRDMFKTLIEQESNIRSILDSKVPVYKEQVYDMKKYIENLL